MLKDYIQLEDLGGEYREIFDLNRSGVPTAVFGVTQGEKYHIGGSLRRPVLYIAKDAVYAKKAQTELEAISGEKVVYLSAKDDVLLYKKAFNKESMYRRITALYDIKQGVKTVVTTFDSLLQLFPMDVKSADIEKGKEYSLEKLCLSLVDMGYTRKELIEGKGDFTLHGDMLEVFPINADCIFRCDFFGDEVEKIRKRDPDSGEFIEETDMFTVVMAYDFYIEEIHHSQKKDAPSGTAKLLKREVESVIDKNAPVFSLRGGDIKGIHSLYVLGKNEMIELKHTAYSREIFAEGALRAADRIINKPPKLYSLSDLF